MDDRKVSRQAVDNGGASSAAARSSTAAALDPVRPSAPARPSVPDPPLSNSEKKAIEQGKAAVVDGKLVESNVGKIEGRS